MSFGSAENTKHFYNICTMLDQRRRRWADVVQMLYKCFVFAGCSYSIDHRRSGDDVHSGMIYKQFWLSVATSLCGVAQTLYRNTPFSITTRHTVSNAELF